MVARFFLVLAAGLVALALAVPARGQCPGGVCPPSFGGFGGGFAPAPGPAFAPAPAPLFAPAPPVFVPAPLPAPAPAAPAAPAAKACDCDPCRCCGACPCGGKRLPPVRKIGQAAALPTGVVRDRLGEGPEYRLNGVPITRDEARRVIEQGPGGRLTDDSSMPRLTVIGEKAECDRVLSDLAGAPALERHRGKYLVQAYRPGNPILRLRGLDAGGKPAIWVQDPSGKVLLPGGRPLTEYPGPEKFAAVLDGKQPDPPPAPGPKPAPQPGPAPGPAPAPWWRQVPASAWAVLAVVVLYLWARKEK